MRRARPTSTAHRGSVEAAGLFFPESVVPEGEARRRILALWKPGAEVYRIEEGWALRLARPVRVFVDLAPGTPLVDRGGVLCAVPATDEELKAAGAVRGDLLLVRAGQCDAIRLGPSIEPASWLDVEGWTFAAAAALASPTAEVVDAAEAPPFEGRAKFAGVPAASPEMEAIAAGLRSGEGASRGSGRPPSWLARLVRWLPRFGSAGSGGRGAGAASGSPAAPRVLGRLFAKLLDVTRLSSFLGARYARYMRRLMDMFESSDLTEALRHAIPLGGDAKGLDFPGFGLPSPRDNLAVSPTVAEGGGGLGVGFDLYGYLQQLYRRAFERLEAEGQIDQAAFVLSDLLRAEEEAVAFLEKHGRLRLAAELAEGRKLSPALVIRQWFLAGDRERAARIALRSGALAEAVLLLERTHLDEGRSLRVLWAEALAQQGDYSAAIEAVWPVEESRLLADTWIDRVLEWGGVPAARMLVRKLEVSPAAAADLVPRGLALLDDEAADRAPEREALVEELRTANPEAALPLVKAAVRSSIRDLTRGVGRMPVNRLRQLVDQSGDGALRADLPTLIAPAARPLRLRTEARELTVTGSGGAVPILDAALLPDGRVLVALGEAGAMLYSREGKRITHFRQPAHELVVSDHGDRALAVARRGEIRRLTRLELRNRRAEEWCDLRIESFASEYDGRLWLVSLGGVFHVLDTHAEKPESIWNLRDLRGSIEAIRRSDHWCSFLLYQIGDRDEWDNPCPPWERREVVTIQFPPFTVRYRRPVETPAGEALAALATSASGLITKGTVRRQHSPEGAMEPREWDEHRLLLQDATVEADPHWTGTDLLLATDSGWCVAAWPEPGGYRVEVVDSDSKRVPLRLHLPGVTRVGARLAGELLTVWDDRGRVTVVELLTGSVAREIRVG